MLAIYARTSRYLSGEIHTIDQQIEAGKSFAQKHGINPDNYIIFADEGISGYETEDTGDPYANRPQFLALMELLEKGGLDSIWVWENSRLSRNTYASAYIYRKINKKNKERIKHHKEPIELWVQDTKYDLANPTDSLMKGIMDSFAEYERNMIVARTTRGLYKAIDSGKRSFSHFYGYTKGARNNSGNFEYIVNDFELDNVRIAYKMFLEGKTLKEICLALMEKKPDNKKDIIKISTKWGRILRHKEYTGFTLNREGLKIEQKFTEGLLNNLDDLLDENKYWVKSQVYTEQLISIPDWIKVREKLEAHKLARKEYDSKNGKNYIVSSALATGLIECSVCNQKYFIYKQKYKDHSGNWVLDDNGEVIRHTYYKHSSLFNNKSCNQKPKTIKQEKVDYILGFFYFYYSLIFDDSENRRQQTLISIKEQKNILKAEIAQKEADYKKYDKVVKAIEKAIEESPETYQREVLRLTKYEDLRDSLAPALTEARAKLINLEEKYSGSERKKEFQNWLFDLQQFFLLGTEKDHRIMLMKIIKSVKIYSNYLVIQTETKYFVFKIDVDDRALEPYKALPFEFLGLSNNMETVKNLWEKFKNDELDFHKPEVQEYLINLFSWKKFIVSDENIELEVHIDFPDNSTVIYFDETRERTKKQLQQKAISERYRRKKGIKTKEEYLKERIIH